MEPKDNWQFLHLMSALPVPDHLVARGVRERKDVSIQPFDHLLGERTSNNPVVGAVDGRIPKAFQKPRMSFPPRTGKLRSCAGQGGESQSCLSLEESRAH